MKAVITGANGQDGSYLAKLLVSKGYSVVAVLREPSSNTDNHRLLGIDQAVEYASVDLTNLGTVQKFLATHQPDEVYHLAAQSSVSVSFNKPIETISYNVLPLVNLLEAIRNLYAGTKLYHASSSDMFGNAASLPITLDTQMRPSSPYAVSKASAFWTLNSYRESFDLNVASGVLFNHESILRPKTFFVKKVVSEAVEIHRGLRSHLEVGNVFVSRDFGYAPEYVEAMWLIFQAEKPKDYIISSGRSVLLHDIVKYVFSCLDIRLDLLKVNQDLVRPTDIKDIYGDNSSAREELGWESRKDIFQIANEMIAHELAESGAKDVP